MRGCKLLIFNSVEQKVFLLGNLNNVNFPDNGLFVISGNAIQTYDYIQYVPSRLDNFNLLPSGDDEPVVVMLLRRQKEDPDIPISEWDLLKVGKRYVLDLNEKITIKTQVAEKVVNLWDIIKKTIVDMQIFGRHKNLDLQFYTQLCNRFQECNFVLYHSLYETLRPGETMGWCSSVKNMIPRPFKFANFKRGSPTPGTDNDCEVTTFLTDVLEHENEPYLTTEGVVSKPVGGRQCPKQPDIVATKLLTEIEYEISSIRKEFNNSFSIPEYPLGRFSEHIANFISLDSMESKRLGEKLGPLQIVEHPLFQYARGIICSVCRERVHSSPHTIKTQARDALMQEEGYYGSDEKRTTYYVLGHLEKNVHLQSILHYVRNKRRNFLADRNLRPKYLPTEGTDIQKLENHFKAAYGMVRLGLAPSNYYTLTSIIKSTGGVVGPHLVSPKSAFNMISFMAQEIKSSVVSYLIEKNRPFSLMMDGTSDLQNRHLIVIFIQTHEGNRPQTYLWRLGEMKGGSTAQDYINLIDTYVKQETIEFQSYFMRRMVSLITDGENTMKKFHRDFDQYYKKKSYNGEVIKLVHILCLAHKLNSATRAALIPLKRDTDLGPENCLPSFANVELVLNSVATWIKIAHTRISAFRAMQESLDLPKIQLMRIFEGRWVASEYRSIDNFIESLPTLIGVLQDMATDPTLQANIRDDANKKLNEVRDPRFIFVLHALLDFTYTFKQWSISMQKSGALAIDQSEAYKNVLLDMDKQEKFEGDILVGYLKLVKCEVNNEWIQGCTVDQYLQNTQIVFKKEVLKTSNMLQISSPEILIPALAKKAKSKLEDYIPLEQLKVLAMFNPSNFPVSKQALYTQWNNEYDLSNLQVVCNMLGLENPKMIESWITLVSSIMDSPQWGQTRNIRPSSAFWMTVKSDTSVEWDANTIELVNSVTTIVVGSVKCETAFSAVSLIKNAHRTTLSTLNLEAILRVKMQGPKHILDFDPVKYAWLWVRAGKFTPDMEPPIDNDEDEENVEQVDEFVVAEEGIDFSEFDMTLSEGEKNDPENEHVQFTDVNSDSVLY
ncbi:uncharacterized protein LOC118437188 [Folsomia candida]|uniref:uncharacterized protein LOC118437188 n=1 Tax=Folsomia candida TaxID=158441 RepID=UPI0016052CEA|nr:uncharacterized protein LOC118437188 [Folsomia candida]XP_035711929.1 uncharacterized protein LOC118437188 [Folsomia candida]